MLERPFPLREAHCHIAMFGEALSLPNAGACESIDELLALLARVCEEAKRSGRAGVRVLGARPMPWPQRRWPTMAELTRASGAVPVVVMSFDHHEAVANNAAITLAKLRAGQPVPPKGFVHADASGEPSGLLSEHAAYRVWDALSTGAETVEHQQAAARVALHRYAALGFAEVHDLCTPPALAEAILGLDISGELAAMKMQVRLFPLVDDLAAIHAMVSAARPANVRVAGAKLFADGTLNARTAATLAPCAEPLEEYPLGRMMVSPAEIDAAINAADAFGLPLATHAIGDRAVREVLDAYERVRPRARGQRIEHCELVDPADVPRFVQLGVTASVQPCQLLADVPVLTRLHGESLHKVLPLRSWLASGLAAGRLDGPGLVFGSDAPIVGPEPEDSIIAAMTLGDGLNSLNPGEAIDDRAAWACFAIA